jgi:alkanesulfonate monooxygenase SsuD/methylene tetrahydromethanopterin reductase-like flavin-dependent oxidoreductase (luciferase family)
VPTVTTTHTEPFHVSKNLATLDLVSHGRAGWMVAVSPSVVEAHHFGRRDPASAEDLYAEAGEAMDVVGRLWDSWEDDAVIRDVATGRYIDRTKLHTTDFEGRYFSVRGPSITPRSPQGRSVVMIEAVNAHAVQVGIEWADVLVIEAANTDEARAIRGQIEQGLRRFDRDPGEIAVLAFVDALLESTDASAQRTRAELDGRAAAPPAALSFDGTGAGLAELLGSWAQAGVVDGFVLRPATLPVTLAEFVEHTVPALQDADLFRVEYDGTTLREHFGLERPPNRYATTAGTTARTGAGE